MSGAFDYKSVVHEAACGDANAADFLFRVIEVAHLWDDMVDRDKPISDDDINRAFITALVTIPRNKFFQAYVGDLTAVMMVAIQNWLAATRVERGAIEALPLEAAFILRSSFVDLLTLVATINGGRKHGAEVAARVRAMAHREGMTGYLENLTAERTAREGSN